MSEKLIETKRENLETGEESQPPPEKTNNKLLIIIFSSGLLIIIITLVLLFLNRNKIKILYEGEILKPFADDKEYSFILLVNDMTVALISDNKTEVSGCGLTVKAGSFYDIYEGLAVYSSKMILAGSEKYSNDTDTYIDKIKEMEGDSLINTLNNKTTFAFHVHNSGFEDILDVFASILDKPKLTVDNVRKSEFEPYMNAIVQSTDSFFYASNNSKFLLKQVVKDFAYKNHPYHNFTLGNYKTLNSKMPEGSTGTNYSTYLLSDVKSYFDTFYKTKYMSLILYSNKTIKEMKKLVGDLFVYDSHNSLSAEYFLFKDKIKQSKTFPYDESNTNIVALYSSTNWNSIYFAFNLHDIHSSKIAVKQALEYFKYVFFSQQSNTLIHSLMEKEFIFEYTIDDSDIGFDNFNIFAFRLHIHRNNFESKYIEIITSVYEYIEKIKKEGITKELYDNMRAIKNFKFNSQENTKEILKITSKLSSYLFSGDYQYFLKGKNYPDFDEEVKKALESYFANMTYNHSIVVIASNEQNFTNIISKGMINKTLAHYDLKYFHQPDILRFLKNQTLYENQRKNGNEYEIRKVNEKIPNFNKNDLVEPKDSPFNLNDSLTTFMVENLPNYDYSSYFAIENNLKVPKVEVVLNFHSPHYYPCKKEKNDLFIPVLTLPYILEALLKQNFYEDFEVANSFEIQRKLDFFYLKLILFKSSDSYINLLERIIKNIFNTEIQYSFERIGRAQLRQELLDYNQTGIDSIAKTHAEYLKSIVSEDYINAEEILEYLRDNITFPKDYYKTIINSVHLNVTIIGNTNETDAKLISSTISNIIKEHHIQYPSKRHFTVTNMTENQIYYYYLFSSNPSERQDSISVFFQIGINNFKKYVYTKLFNICIGDLFINALREFQTTNVESGLVLFHNILYYQITVYVNNEKDLYQIDIQISNTLKNATDSEVGYCPNFVRERDRVIKEGQKLFETNYYEVTEQVLRKNENLPDYNDEDNLIENITTKTIQDYFNKKFRDSPKKITVIEFDQYQNKSIANNTIEKIQNNGFVLKPSLKPNVTDNFKKFRIYGPDYYREQNRYI